MSKPLAISQLYRSTPLKHLPFRNTRRLKPMTDFLGQDRARESAEMAVAMPHDGFADFSSLVAREGWPGWQALTGSA